MSINWQHLRPWDGSRNKAFEELCCQLASYENEPLSANAKFIRKGTPDAGVECYWQYPNGDEWGFQAKFFLNASQIDWSQIDNSVKTALEKHPRLTRYTICLPIDRPDARISGQESCLEKWNKRVEKWNKWTQGKNMSVEFNYWGEHEIFTRLSREEHAGRYFFWFNKEQLSQRWFEEHLGEVTANAGPRYSPEFNVELPISQFFDSLGRTKEFFDRIKKLYGETKRTYSRAKSNKANEVAGEEFANLEKELNPLFSILASIDNVGTQQIDFSKIITLSENAQEAVRECTQVLVDKAAEDEKKKAAASRKQPDSREKFVYNHPEDFSYGKQYLYELMRKFDTLNSFAHSNLATLANKPALLLVGDAGSGKTHLFCDVAKNRIQNNLPTVLLLGEQFNQDDPWSQIINQLRLSCQNRNEFLGALEAAAQARNSKAIIIIDALNEGEGKTLWKKHLAGMLAVLARYPRLAIAISVRSSYEQTVIPERLVQDKLVRVDHYGFAQHEYEATRTFFDFFGIERPSIPILTPEFQNPLFLKIFCKGLKKRGLTRVPTGLHGITAIFQFFIESVNKKLAQPEYLDFDEKQHFVLKAVKKVTKLMADKKRNWLPREETQPAVDAFLPRQGYEQSLFRNLISEGLLAEDMFWVENSKERIEGIRFPYERFADHLIAQYLLDKYLDPENPAKSFQIDQALGSLMKNEVELWKNRGIIEALCIQLPERIGKELIEVAPHCADCQSIKEASLDSIIWRNSKAVTKATLNYINEYIITDEDNHHRFLDALLTVATNPVHPYNADFLHRTLINKKLAERDAWWSIYLHYQYGEHSAVDRIVDWAWSEEDKSHIDDEPIRLCGIALAWFLTTSNRFLRDRATKALVSLLTDRIHILRQIIPKFLEINDPYVLERLFAVAYGCAMRSNDDNAIEELAKDVYEWIFKDGTPPPHILLRDYSRGVIEVAVHRGIKLDIDIEKKRPPYKSEWLEEIPDEEELRKRYKKQEYRSIWSSLMYNFDGFPADFGNSEVNSSLSDWSSRILGSQRIPNLLWSPNNN